MVPPEKVNEVIGQVDDSDFISIDIDLRMYRSAQSENSQSTGVRGVFRCPCSEYLGVPCSFLVAAAALPVEKKSWAARLSPCPIPEKEMER